MSLVSLPLGATFCSDIGKGRKEPSWKKSERTLAKFLLTGPALTNLKGHQASCFESTSPCTLSCRRISCGWIENRHFKHKRSQRIAVTPTALFNNYIERGMAECEATVPSPGSCRAWGAPHTVQGTTISHGTPGYLQQWALARACHTWPLSNYQEL